MKMKIEIPIKLLPDSLDILGLRPIAILVDDG
jgi:hypothetical protein